MKKLLSIILTVCTLCMCIPTMSIAADDVTVELNGIRIYFDVPPQIINDRTMVPMRAIFEAMKCDVEWNESRREICVYKDEVKILEMQIDNNLMLVLEEIIDENTSRYSQHYLDVSPQIINSRTLVPRRAISESMGADVRWNEYSRKVTIFYDYQPTYIVNDDINISSTPKPTAKPTATPKATATPTATPKATDAPIETPKAEYVYVKDLSMEKRYSDGERGAISTNSRNGITIEVDLSDKRNVNLEKGDETTTYVEYDVSDYSRFMCSVWASWGNKVGLRVYGDNELLYETPFLSSSGSSNIDVDLSGYRTLRLEGYGTVSSNSHSVIMKDAKLYY